MPAPTSRKPTAGPVSTGCCAPCSLQVLPDPKLFRLALFGALVGEAAGAAVAPCRAQARSAAMLSLAPARSAAPGRDRRTSFPAPWPRRGRVALLSGCVANVLAPQINAAAIRVLNRHGFDVVIAAGEGCCGSLAHHMGREAEAHASARRNIDAWTGEIDGEGLDAILIDGVRLRHDHQGLRLHAAH